MVTTTDKSALLAFEDSNRQRHLLPMAAFAASLTRVSGVHSFKPPAGAFSLAFRYREKLPPGHVKNSLCKMAVLHHPANVQILDGDSVKPLDQLRRHFVVKMLARSVYYQVAERDFPASLPAILTALYLTRQSPLLSRESRRRLFEMARVGDFFASAECSEARDADVHADSLSGRGSRRGFRYFANYQSVPAVSAPRDSQLLATALNRTGKPHTASPNPGNSQLVAFDRTRPDFLVFLGKGVVSVTALESWEARVLSELQASK